MRAGLSVVIVAALPAAATAHHSFFGRFDTQTLVELTGEVTEVLWRNPHAYFSVRADGVVWEIETSSLTVLKRMGIDEGTIRVGDRITVAANPPIGDKREMYARHALLARRPRIAPERRPEAALDGACQCSRRRVVADGARGRRLAAGSRHLSRLEPHAHHRAAVSRGDGCDGRHQRVSVDACRARAARRVRSAHRQSDGELRAERHADGHGSAVSDRIRAAGERRHLFEARGVRSDAAHLYEDGRDARAAATFAARILAWAVSTGQRSS